jgi:hypothetical protein
VVSKFAHNSPQPNATATCSAALSATLYDDVHRCLCGVLEDVHNLYNCTRLSKKPCLYSGNVTGGPKSRRRLEQGFLGADKFLEKDGKLKAVAKKR